MFFSLLDLTNGLKEEDHKLITSCQKYTSSNIHIIKDTYKDLALMMLTLIIWLKMFVTLDSYFHSFWRPSKHFPDDFNDTLIKTIRKLTVTHPLVFLYWWCCKATISF